MIVQTNAIQFLPQLFMNQFDTVLSTLWIHIEHMHEGVFFSNKIIIDKRARKYQNDIQIGH